MLAPEDLDRDDSSVAGFDNQVPLKEPPVVKLLVLTCPDSSYDGYGGYGLIILLPACGSWAFITFIDDEITSSIHSGSKAFDDLPVRTIAKH